MAEDAMAMVLTVAVMAELIVAAVIDARSRTFPNGLALCLAATCAVCSYVLGGANRLVFVGACALAVCIPLMGLELLWRRTHEGRTGLGMGDVKFLAAFMLVWPLGAVLSFSAGLVLLAVAGICTRRPSFPLLPFVVAAVPFVAMAVPFVARAL